MNAEEALERLKEGNRRYVGGADAGDVSASVREDKARNGQRPYAVVIACSDSRVIPETIFNAGIGDLFVIRVAGNVIDPHQLGSVEYAAAHLHCPLVLVLGHTGCGAVSAALEIRDAAATAGTETLHSGNGQPSGDSQPGQPSGSGHLSSGDSQPSGNGHLPGNGHLSASSAPHGIAPDGDPIEYISSITKDIIKAAGSLADPDEVSLRNAKMSADKIRLACRRSPYKLVSEARVIYALYDILTGEVKWND
jgi:carbonic anhydrase